MMKRNLVLSLALWCGMALHAQQAQRGTELYWHMDAPIEARIHDLLDRMTVEEKISLLRETSPEITRLGVNKYFMGNEALHGVVRPGRFTVFPQAIALASMWNPELHHRIAIAISDEARARWNELDQGTAQKQLYSDLLVFWSPTVNMARDPRWGRTPETYGEDPYLSGVLGAAFVRGLQGDDPRYLKVVATPKHFVANNEEHNRFECAVEVPMRDLREYYLPAFERCVREGHAQSIMTAYPSINGVPCSANPWLLQKVLREEWGFDGFVVSDCGAAVYVMSEHKYARLPETTAALCLKAGLDLECGSSLYVKPMQDAYDKGMVTTADIDSAAFRILRGRMRLGMFDDSARVPYSKIGPDVVGCDAHNQLALEAARQSMVLLKNEKHFLPLNDKRIKRIAVLGINADKCEFGDYSGKPVRTPVSVLEGIRRRVGDKVEIYTVPWKSVDIDTMSTVSGQYFPNGLQAEYFDNVRFEGTPKQRTDALIDLEPKNQAPDPFLPKGAMAVRWTGQVSVPVTGRYTFQFTGKDGYRLYVDDKVVIDSWDNHAKTTLQAEVMLDADVTHRLKVEYFAHDGDGVARLQWRIPDMPLSLDWYAPDMARQVSQCDVVVAVMGINREIEREGQDRTRLTLPADQELFLKELQRVNPNVALVLVAGSSMAMEWEQQHLPAILCAWYPGEQGGQAVTETLFGDVNPAGRLPLTFYRSMDDLPPFDNYDMTLGRTYQYFKGTPLYPFGFGLSYTQFKYRDLKVQSTADEVTVSFTVCNVGHRDGDEVAQVYVQYPPQSDRPLPLKQLRGFRRVSVEKGGRERVTISIPRADLRLWDDGQRAFHTPTGTYHIMVGQSSAHICLEANVEL